MFNFIKYNLHYIILQITCIMAMVMLLIFIKAWNNRDQEVRAVIEEYEARIEEYEARLEIFESPVETCYMGL